MFEVSVEHTFAAGHALRNYRGKCENVHGHNYRVRVTLRGEKLDQTGMLADFTALKRLLRDICEPLDHVFINEMEPFVELNPTAENLAWYFCLKMQSQLVTEVPVEVAEVKVWETDIQSATYRPAPTLSNK
jgi:6-pyruvoyltetrahydropterin/6-carboxytetrahydropterin synthase